MTEIQVYFIALTFRSNKSVEKKKRAAKSTFKRLKTGVVS